MSADVKIPAPARQSRQQRCYLMKSAGLLACAPAGLQVAGRCIPADGHVAGGDWYDIIPLPGGRTGLAVGDAMGHGPEAAPLKAQLRATARALAGMNMAPGRLLHHLDLAAATVRDAYATCLYAVLDRAAACCTIARAGHLPPVLALPDCSTHVPQLPAGLPLGLGTAPSARSVSRSRQAPYSRPSPTGS